VLAAELTRREDLRDRLNGIAIDVGEIWLERIVFDVTAPQTDLEFPSQTRSANLQPRSRG